MKNYSIAKSRRIRSTPYTSRIEKQGVTSYTVYNHMLLPAAFGSIEDSYHHLKKDVQVWLWRAFADYWLRYERCDLVSG